MGSGENLPSCAGFFVGLYDRLKWQQTLKDLEKALVVSYEDVLSEFDEV